MTPKTKYTPKRYKPPTFFWLCVVAFSLGCLIGLYLVKTGG